MNCNVCGKQWHGPDGYCPQCGSPVLPRRRSGKLWEVLLVLLVVIVAVWAVTRSK